jgi:hypothetical protein
MLLTPFILQGIELLAGACLWSKVRRDRTRQILIFGKFQPTEIPILDKQLEKWAGSPSKAQRFGVRRIVMVARKLVNTKAFEHIITALVNNKSEAYRRFKPSPLVLIP